MGGASAKIGLANILSPSYVPLLGAIVPTPVSVERFIRGQLERPGCVLVIFYTLNVSGGELVGILMLGRRLCVAPSFIKALMFLTGDERMYRVGSP